MKASVATDYDVGQNKNCKNNIQDFFGKNPNLLDDEEENKFDLSSIDIKMNENDNPLNTPKKQGSPKGMTAALHDISAIQESLSGNKPHEQQHFPLDQDQYDQILDQTGNSDQKNLEALNRNLMPNLSIKVKDKIIKMPMLDIEKAIVMEARENFTGNISGHDAQSLVTDLKTDCNADGLSQNESFQNESHSKAFESKSKNPSQAQLDADAQDILNQCDQAISQIFEGKSSLDRDHDVQLVGLKDLSEILKVTPKKKK